MKHKILAVIVALVMIIGTIPAVSAASDDELAATGDTVIPKITSVAPSANGATVNWTPFNGAAKYYVFIQKPEGGWKVIGSTSATSFEHKKPDSAATYIYTVRAANRNGDFVSGYDRAGFAFRCLSVPVLQTPVSVVGGLRLSWQPVDGASAYTVYVKNPTGWKAIARTSSGFYLDTDVASGEKYTYTVRCYDAANRVNQSYFDRKGISGDYIAAPQIYACKPVSGGVTVHWEAVDGTPVYAVFMKRDGRWRLLGKTSETQFSHLGLTEDQELVFTVRCMDKSGSFISGYEGAGFRCWYLTPPHITDASENTVRWEPDENAAGYRVYRKEFGKSWIVLGETGESSFVDETAQADTIYTYTARCIDEEGQLISVFVTTNLWYVNGALADGDYNIGGKTVRFENGIARQQGYVTIDGRMYYYNANGELMKDGLVGSSREGWRYADKDGVVQLNYTGLATNTAGTWYVTNGLLDRTLRTAVTIGGTDYIVINGKATPAVTEKQITLFRAFKLIEKATTASMSKSEKLKACFYYIIDITTEENPRIPDTHEQGYPELYANDIFLNQTGNCFSYASSFAYCAKALGYNNIYICNSEFHGWAEIEGLVYDPQQTKYQVTPFYALSYDCGFLDAYAASIDDSIWWTHVPI